MTSILLWRRGPLVIRLWPWRWIDIIWRVSAGLFILNNFPSFLGREDNPPGNKPEHWCKLSIIRLFFCFYFIRTGAFDEQEAKVWILEDDSMKQEFHKQAHETLLLSSSEEEWNWPHFHWPVSDSCQVRRMTDGTNWIHSRDMIEVRSTTLGKEMRRSTRLYTYEESLTDGQEVDNVSLTAGLSAFLIQLHRSLRLLLVLGSGYPSFWKASYSSEESLILNPFSQPFCPNERSILRGIVGSKWIRQQRMPFKEKVMTTHSLAFSSVS